MHYIVWKIPPPLCLLVWWVRQSRSCAFLSACWVITFTTLRSLNFGLYFCRTAAYMPHHSMLQLGYLYWTPYWLFIQPPSGLLPYFYGLNTNQTHSKIPQNIPCGKEHSVIVRAFCEKNSLHVASAERTKFSLMTFRVLYEEHDRYGFIGHFSCCSNSSWCPCAEQSYQLRIVILAWIFACTRNGCVTEGQWS